jgi:hypothetical protein
MFPVQFLPGVRSEVPVADPAGTGGSGLMVIVLLLALLVAGSALLRGVGVLWALISELLGAFFAGLGALLLIGIAIMFVIIAFVMGFGGPTNG